MVIDDSNNLISWWRKQLEGTESWNSLPNEAKNQLLLKLQRCISALLHVYITKEEILKLVQLTDIITVFESCISMLALPDLERKNKHQILAYLTRVVLNSELAKIKKDPTWHVHPPAKKRKGKIATIQYAQKFNPYNFKSHCKVCGNNIRKDNATSICSKCQKKGRNGI
jgi:hypothetical protein